MNKFRKIIEKKNRVKITCLTAYSKNIASIIDKLPNAESKINSTLIPDILSIEKRLSTSTLIPKRVMFIFSIKGNKIIVAGSGTSGNGFIKMTGSENIFGTIEGWKSVSQEAVIKENPDYIIMSQRDLHNSETIFFVTNVSPLIGLS